MIKPKWRTIKTYDGFKLRFPEKMQLNDGLVANFDEYLQRISVSDSRMELGNNLLVKSKDEIKCVDMEVVKFARERGIGGLMHAIAVMIMKENNAKLIYLDSLAEAIRFHFNKGFSTRSVDKTNAAIYMKGILASNTPFNDLKKRAADLLYDLSLGGKTAIEKANKLYNEFITRSIQNNITIENASFPKTLKMDMKAKEINKKMYNEILQNFGIDYTI